MNRCKWVNLDNLKYVEYHDNEWGIITKTDDRYLFEMLLLESFQAGLTWECVLNKREGFKKAFDDFDYKKISKYNEKDIDRLMNDNSIIRNRRKIISIIKNANIYIKIIDKYGSFYKYIESNRCIDKDKMADNISNYLYKEGMRFVGKTIIYSYLESIGIFNNHDKECYRYGG